MTTRDEILQEYKEQVEWHLTEAEDNHTMDWDYDRDKAVKECVEEFKSLIDQLIEETRIEQYKYLQDMINSALEGKERAIIEKETDGRKSWTTEIKEKTDDN